MPRISIVPDPTSLQLDHLAADEHGLTIVLATKHPTVCCPDCEQPSRRVYSWYRRTVADLPWQGRPVRLRLRTRRWVCSNSACSRRIFTERLPGVVAPYARRTARLAVVVEAIALALGGEGGARILAALGVVLSPDTLLYAIRVARRPAAPPPRVVGIDDWTWRRGRRFGTILVDLERHAVIDLLPDRTTDSVVRWLERQPQVAVIARDRGGVYAEAAAKGAPQATQVADRWHLLHNLAGVLEEFLLQHRAALRHAAMQPDSSPQAPAAPDAPSTPLGFGASPASAPGPLTPTRPRLGQQRAEQASRQRHARLVEQYETIRRLHAAGADVADIARRVGVSRRTVYRYRDLPEPPDPPRPRRSRRLLTSYEPYLLQRWEAGCHNGMRLYREIREQGYAYGASNVMRFVAQLRRDEAAGQPAGTSRRAAAAQAPTARHVAGLFLRRPADLKPDQQAYLDHLQGARTAVATAYRLTQTFAAMVRERGGERLDDWLAEAESSNVAALRRFAKGLRKDLAAVRAGLIEQWSNGPTEGFVHKVKLVKRQAYGRAGFAVLRQRVVRAS
jgi:transposase